MLAPVKRERCTPEVRRKAILEAAAEVFLERGYAGTSVDAVVERAGGSKATVYSLFGNKEGLLTALVAEGAEELGESLRTLATGDSLDQSLRAIGASFLKLVLTPKRMALYRLVLGECGRFPEAGDIYYRTGPEAFLTHLTEFFRGAIAEGAIEPGDPHRLAGYFVGALRGDLYFRALFNPTRIPTAKEIHQHVDFVVSHFLRHHARERAAG